MLNNPEESKALSLVLLVFSVGALASILAVFGTVFDPGMAVLEELMAFGMGLVALGGAGLAALIVVDLAHSLGVTLWRDLAGKGKAP